jgi:hypothetical protein
MAENSQMIKAYGSLTILNSQFESFGYAKKALSISPTKKIPFWLSKKRKNHNMYGYSNIDTQYKYCNS